MFEGNREHEYRAATNRRAGQMTGVSTQISFLCRVCKQYKPKAGRKNMVPKANQFGYRCAECVAKREAA